MSEVTIYVRLTDEAVEVWRPVAAESISAGVYRIASADPDVAVETWEFRSGDLVRCERREIEGGQFLVAVGRVEKGGSGRFSTWVAWTGQSVVWLGALFGIGWSLSRIHPACWIVPAAVLSLAAISALFRWLFETPEGRHARLAEAKRTRDANAAAQAELETFINETRSVVPRAPVYPEAALFRCAWQRALVLEEWFRHQEDRVQAHRYSQFREHCARSYHGVAPENLYGPVPLKVSPRRYARVLVGELRRLYPQEGAGGLPRPLACIYVGRDTETGRIYVGQTVNAPELRWVQHRKDGTGPFKGGARYVEWEVVRENVDIADLPYWESFFIGYYECYPGGHNSNPGLNAKGYEDGRSRRDNESGRKHDQGGGKS